jgi:RHO1 GDP-GTP exchange protein 1/2
MDKGAPAKWQWHDLVTPKQRRDFTTEESQRQGLIFELIKSEMAYVRDLENIETVSKSWT